MFTSKMVDNETAIRYYSGLLDSGNMTSEKHKKWTYRKFVLDVAWETFQSWVSKMPKIKLGME